MRMDRRQSIRSRVLRWLVGLLSAAMLIWTLVPAVEFGIFNLGSVALLLAFTLLLSGSLFFPALCRMLARLRRSRAGRWGLRTAAALLAVCVGSVAVVAAMMADASTPADGGEEVRAVIVLGCQTDGYQPSPMLENRLEKAREYLLAHPDAVAVVTGGEGPGEGVSEAESMGRWLQENGIAPERILREDRSANTEENLKFSARLLRERGIDGRCAVVSDWWHLYRARHWARVSGLSMTPVACATPVSLLPVFFMREFCGVARLLVAGY